MFHPKKHLGQHFLTDNSVAEKIIEAAELSRADTVVEIGPGTGVLTKKLTRIAQRVIAIEKDLELCALLNKNLASQKNLEIICADVLKINPVQLLLAPRSYKIVANIPYYITGRFLRFLFETWPMPRKAVLMLQLEVAKRITAMPPKMNRLAAIAQYFSKPRIVRKVSKNAFSPAPKVNSAVIVLDFPKNSSGKNPKIAELISAGFSSPRKHLASNLKSKFSKETLEKALQKMALPKNIRPAELTIADWEKLSTYLDLN